MQVVAKDRVVEDANAEADAGVSERLLDELLALPAPQISDARLHAQSDVHRVPRLELSAFQVRNASTREPRMGSGARAPSAFASSAPLWKRER